MCENTQCQVPFWILYRTLKSQQTYNTSHVWFTQLVCSCCIEASTHDKARHLARSLWQNDYRSKCCILHSPHKKYLSYWRSNSFTFNKGWIKMDFRAVQSYPIIPNYILSHLHKLHLQHVDSLSLPNPCENKASWHFCKSSICRLKQQPLLQRC